MKFVDGMTYKQRGFAILSGAVMAHYLTPVLSFYFASGNYEETIGFLIGLFGMSICGALFRAILKSDVWDLVERRFGNPPEVQ